MLGLAFAQVDDRSRQLLEGLVPAGAVAPTSLDQTMVMTIYDQSTEPIETRTRTVVDYQNRRAVIFTEAAAQGVVMRMIFVDGKASMSIPGVPIAMPVPAEASAMFDTIFDTQQTPILDDATSATYDGVVAYGDLIEGHQVTYTGSYAYLGTTNTTESRLLFDDANEFIGSVSTDSKGDVVMVFDELAFDDRHVGRGSHLYSFDGTNATLTAIITFEDVHLNEPLDESLFE